MSYFLLNVRYQKTMDNGTVKRVTEPYLVDALTCVEAVARITEVVIPTISGDYAISVVKESNIAEVFRYAEDDRWYLAKLAFITIDEKTGAEKRSMTQIMVSSPDFINAYENLMEGMKGTMADFEVVSIAETKVVDVIDHKD